MTEAYEDLLRSFATLHDLPAEALLATGEIVFGGTLVSLVYEGDETTGEILLLGEIGVPSAANEAIICKALLQANNLWAGTGGATLAMDAEGMAIACAKLPLLGLDASLLSDGISDFAETVDYWRAFLQQS